MDPRRATGDAALPGDGCRLPSLDRERRLMTVDQPELSDTIRDAHAERVREEEEGDAMAGDRFE